MADATQELMLEILRKLQGDVSDLKSGQGRIEARLGSLEGHMVEFHRTSGRQESELVELRQRIERIERRLEIST